jgi:hypothetical protein
MTTVLEFLISYHKTWIITDEWRILDGDVWAEKTTGIHLHRVVWYVMKSIATKEWLEFLSTQVFDIVL